jgi:hypothetical protein
MPFKILSLNKTKRGRIISSLFKNSNGTGPYSSDFL